MKQFQKFKQDQENTEQLNEGLLSYASDLISAFRIVKILYQDWTKTNAFKLGIIDAQGNKLKSPEGLEEKSAYSPFIRLIFRMKRLLAMVPGGSSTIGSLAAAYAMLRENEELDMSTLTNEQLESLFEDAPVNVSAGVAQATAPIGKVVRRPGDRIKVDKAEFQRLKTAKIRTEDWRPHATCEELLEYIAAFPMEPITVFCDNENIVYLRGKKVRTVK